MTGNGNRRELVEVIALARAFTLGGTDARGRRHRAPGSFWSHLAGELGAEQVIASTADPAAVIPAQGGADVDIALAAEPSAYQQALRSLRRGGRLVCVGIPANGVLPRRAGRR